MREIIASKVIMRIMRAKTASKIQLMRSIHVQG